MSTSPKRALQFPEVGILVAIIGLVLAGGCKNRTVPSELRAAVASGAPTFDFASASTFAWDRMFVFGCYTSRSDVETALGFEWPDFRKTSIESSDSVCLVVFVRGTSVVYWYEQPRSVELGGLANRNGYLPSEAKFRVAQNVGRAELMPIATHELPQ